MVDMCCKKCNKPLEADEIAIYKRLVSRGAEEFLCIPCLAEYYRCSESIIHERIAFYKRIGCTRFVKDENTAASGDSRSRDNA